MTNYLSCIQNFMRGTKEAPVWQFYTFGGNNTWMPHAFISETTVAVLKLLV